MSGADGLIDCPVCGAKNGAFISMDTNCEPYKTVDCGVCGYSYEENWETTLIGFRRKNDSELIPDLFRRIADIMEETVRKEADDAGQQRSPTEGAVE